MAESYRRWSPYNYAVDNPLRFIDPDGNGPKQVIDAIKHFIQSNFTSKGWQTSHNKRLGQNKVDSRNSNRPVDNARYGSGGQESYASNSTPENHQSTSSGESWNYNTWPNIVTTGLDEHGKLKAERIGNWNDEKKQNVYNSGPNQGQEIITDTKTGDVIEKGKVTHEKPVDLGKNDAIDIPYEKENTKSEDVEVHVGQSSTLKTDKIIEDYKNNESSKNTTEGNN